jgi:hypothetical protein
MLRDKQPGGKRTEGPVVLPAMNLRLSILLPLLAIGAAPASVDPVKAVAGRYSVTFPDAFVSGEEYTGENIVEIVPVSPRAAYVRVATDWYNGHSCSLWGVAVAEGDRLVYHDPDKDSSADHGQCILSIRRVGRSLRLNDEDRSGCYARYCGARGSFTNVDLPFSSRRRITYEGKLKASRQFKEAMAAWCQAERSDGK